MSQFIEEDNKAEQNKHNICVAEPVNINANNVNNSIVAHDVRPATYTNYLCICCSRNIVFPEDIQDYEPDDIEANNGVVFYENHNSIICCILSCIERYVCTNCSAILLFIGLTTITIYYSIHRK